MEEIKVIKEYFSYFKLVEYKGKEIVYLDISNSRPVDAIKMLKSTREIVSSFSEKSILFFTDYSGVIYDKSSLDELKSFAKFNKPFVNKSAIIGVEGMKKLVYKIVITFSGRTNVKVCDNKEEALDWLVKN